MSIQSMTGFGKGEASGENYNLSVEVKSVNHRFKDYRFKMASLFNAKEMELKKLLDKNFKRGTFDIYINYKKNPDRVESIEVDKEKIINYLGSMKEISEKTGSPYSFSPTEFLRSDFMAENTEKESELHSLLLPAFTEALTKLTESRSEEGQKLIEKLQGHKETYAEHFKAVFDLRNVYQDQVKEKLLKRFEKLSPELTIDEPRFLQEVIYYLEKLDIEEEVERIQIHLDKLRNILNSDGEQGRQIEFLLQELNRETNTVGSKSNHQDISQRVVQMKVQLEKIREQALNLQ